MYGRLMLTKLGYIDGKSYHILHGSHGIVTVSFGGFKYMLCCFVENILGMIGLG